LSHFKVQTKHQSILIVKKKRQGRGRDGLGVVEDEDRRLCDRTHATSGGNDQSFCLSVFQAEQINGPSTADDRSTHAPMLRWPIDPSLPVLSRGMTVGPPVAQGGRIRTELGGGGRRSEAAWFYYALLMLLIRIHRELLVSQCYRRHRGVRTDSPRIPFRNAFL